MSGYDATLEHALQAQCFAVDATAFAHAHTGLMSMVALAAATRYPDLVRKRGSTALARQDAYDDDFEALRMSIGSLVTRGEPRLPVPALRAFAEAVHRMRRAMRDVASELSARFAASGVFARAQISGGFMSLHAACERQCVHALYSAFDMARHVTWLVEAELRKTPRPPGATGMDLRGVMLASDAEALFEPALAAELAEAQHAIVCETQWVAALALEQLVRAATASDLAERLRAHVKARRPRRRRTKAENDSRARSLEYPEAAARMRDVDRLHALVPL